MHITIVTELSAHIPAIVALGPGQGTAGLGPTVAIGSGLDRGGHGYSHDRDGNLLVRESQDLTSGGTPTSDSPGTLGERMSGGDATSVKVNSFDERGTCGDVSLHAARFTIVGNLDGIITSVDNLEALLVVGVGSEMRQGRR